MPKPVRALVSAVVVCGAAIVVACALALIGEPLPEPGLVALVAAGMFLAELFPVRIPGGTEETSFSTGFSFDTPGIGEHEVVGPHAVLREAAVAAIGRWRVLAEDPLMSRDGRTVATGVIRTCEGLAMAEA